MAKSRPKIPDDIKLKLWVASGGRCEFPGCNEPVWRDGLTLKDDNFAHIAHIVAASPLGPRGDAVLSSQLIVDFDNLLLVCLDHSKLVDGRHSHEYSVEFLKASKRYHEERIQRQTAVSPELGTTVVRLIANVRERRMEIPPSQAYDAIAPRFPADDRGMVFDLTGRPGSGDKSYWQSVANELGDQVKTAFAPGNNRLAFDHLSVFAAGPMPLLMYFGNRIGGTRSADIYQKHRDTDDWKWKKEPDDPTFSYVVTRPANPTGARVALSLSLSGTIHPNEVSAAVPDASLYSITIANPTPTFLRRRSQLAQFGIVFRSLLTEIRTNHGSESELSVFPAVPLSIAVAAGREILPKADPHITVYDLDNVKGGFIECITVN